MSMGFPVFITRVNVGKGRGMVLVSMDSPAGELSNGEIKNAEALRVVMSVATLREVTELFASTLREIEAEAMQQPATDRVPDEARFSTMAASRKH
jgi:hypothetical protein